MMSSMVNSCSAAVACVVESMLKTIGGGVNVVDESTTYSVSLLKSFGVDVVSDRTTYSSGVSVDSIGVDVSRA